MNIKYTITLLLTLIIFPGCDQILNKNDPVSVATAYWGATLSGQSDVASKFVSNPEIPMGIKGITENANFAIGDITQNQGYYFVDTTLYILDEEAEEEHYIPFKTVIIPVDGIWKVDVWSTKQSVFDASIDTSVKFVKNSIASSSKYIEDFHSLKSNDKASILSAKQKAKDEFDRALNEIFDSLEKALAETSNVNKDSMETRENQTAIESKT